MASKGHEVFLKYCHNKRDACYHAIANDTSARPGELLNLKISDVIFKLSESGIQYAEIVVSGKTKSRTLPLINSIPYVKEWIQMHPAGGNPNSWLFVSLSKNNFLAKLSHDSLLAKYQYYYKTKYFPMLLRDETILPADKALIKNMLTKPFSLYIFRHSSLTEKFQILKVSTLRDHAGWTMTSKMPNVYIHYFGNESSKSILQAYGVEDYHHDQSTSLKSKMCPNCSEPNRPDIRFCIKCRMVLTYGAYSETLREKQKKDEKLHYLEEDVKSLKETNREILELLKYPEKLAQIDQS